MSARLLAYAAVYDAELTLALEVPGCAVLFLPRDNVDVWCDVLVRKFLAGGDVSCCAEESDIAGESTDGVGKTGVIEVGGVGPEAVA